MESRYPDHGKKVLSSPQQPMESSTASREGGTLWNHKRENERERVVSLSKTHSIRGRNMSQNVSWMGFSFYWNSWGSQSGFGSADRITSAAVLGKTGRIIAYHVFARNVPSTSQPLSGVQRGTYRQKNVHSTVSGRKLGLVECKHRAEPTFS